MFEEQNIETLNGDNSSTITNTDIKSFDFNFIQYENLFKREEMSLGNDRLFNLKEYQTLYIYRQLLLLRSISIINHFILSSTYVFQNTLPRELNNACLYIMDYISYFYWWVEQYPSQILPLIPVQRDRTIEATNTVVKDMRKKHDASVDPINKKVADVDIEPNRKLGHEVLLFYTLANLTTCTTTNPYYMMNFSRAIPVDNKREGEPAAELKGERMGNSRKFLKSDPRILTSEYYYPNIAGDIMKTTNYPCTNDTPTNDPDRPSLPACVSYSEFLFILSVYLLNNMEVIYKCVVMCDNSIKYSKGCCSLLYANYYGTLYQNTINCNMKFMNQMFDNKTQVQSTIMDYQIMLQKRYCQFLVSLIVQDVARWNFHKAKSSSMDISSGYGIMNKQVPCDWNISNCMNRLRSVICQLANKAGLELQTGSCSRINTANSHTTHVNMELLQYITCLLYTIAEIQLSVGFVVTDNEVVCSAVEGRIVESGLGKYSEMRWNVCNVWNGYMDNTSGISNENEENIVMNIGIAPYCGYTGNMQELWHNKRKGGEEVLFRNTHGEVDLDMTDAPTATYIQSSKVILESLHQYIEWTNILVEHYKSYLTHLFTPKENKVHVHTSLDEVPSPSMEFEFPMKLRPELNSQMESILNAEIERRSKSVNYDLKPSIPVCRIINPLFTYCSYGPYYPCPQCLEAHQESLIDKKETTETNTRPKFMRHKTIYLNYLKCLKDMIRCYYSSGIVSITWDDALQGYTMALVYIRQYNAMVTNYNRYIKSSEFYYYSLVLHADILYHLANVYYHMGSFRDALDEIESCFSKICNLDQSLTANRLKHIHMLHSQILCNLGKYEEALAVIMKLEEMSMSTIGPITGESNDFDSYLYVLCLELDPLITVYIDPRMTSQIKALRANIEQQLNMMKPKLKPVSKPKFEKDIDKQLLNAACDILTPSSKGEPKSLSNRKQKKKEDQSPSNVSSTKISRPDSNLRHSGGSSPPHAKKNQLVSEEDVENVPIDYDLYIAYTILLLAALSAIYFALR